MSTRKRKWKQWPETRIYVLTLVKFTFMEPSPFLLKKNLFYTKTIRNNYIILKMEKQVLSIDLAPKY